jgi:hypothetical protein
MIKAEQWRAMVWGDLLLHSDFSLLCIFIGDAE